MSDLLRKAAQAALEALEALYNGRADENRDRKCWLARADLRAALAQPDQPTADGPTLPEPVAWFRAPYGTLEPNPLFRVTGPQSLEWAVACFTEDQLRAAVAAERERCAKVCDDLAANDKLSNYYAVAARAIRKG